MDGIIIDSIVISDTYITLKLTWRDYRWYNPSQSTPFLIGYLHIIITLQWGWGISGGIILLDKLQQYYQHNGIPQWGL